MPVDYMAVVIQMIEDGAFPGWGDQPREMGFLGPTTEYTCIGWRETEFTKPTQEELETEWENHPEKYDVVKLKVEYQTGDDYLVTVTKPYNIDGATEIQVTLNDAPLPVTTALSGDPATGTVTLELLADTVIGIQEDRPHEEVLVEIS